MENIINDTTKFRQLDEDPIKLTIQRENKFKTFLRSLKKDNIISNNVYQELFPTGTRAGILYGLPKIHKPDVPLRPILSSIGTLPYNIAKFLVPLLRPISSGVHMVSDTFSFINELLCSNFPTDNLVMASFDIKSLFTNIPLDETIDIIVNRLFNNSTHFQSFTRDQFTKLLRFSVKNCHFIFNGSLYEQIDGVAMGSPVGPLFANIFLSFHEKTWLNNCPLDFKPVYYRRYVDDCFLLFRSTEHIDLFLNYLNHQHHNIDFTSEVETNKTLSFLDINITRSNGSFNTSVYQKPTFTALFTNFHSFIPLTYKKGLISTLLNRYFKICSSFENFHVEIEKFRKIFNRNGYPTQLYDKCVRVFLDKIYKPAPKSFNVPKKVMYFCLPFTGLHSLQIRTQIQKLCSSAYPHIDFRCAFRPIKRLSHFFPSKDRLPKGLRSRVVYSFTCRCCNVSYVGQTARHLHTRVSDHLGVSALTGKTSVNPSPSCILSHLSETGHTASIDDFRILSSGNSTSELLVKESLLIRKLNPLLNSNISSVPLSLF